MQKEAKARIIINDLLKRSGWRFFDNENGPANITLETHLGDLLLHRRWHAVLLPPD